mmetsp:Transcript_12739/g.12398  ORF Transcript_12739/g.12398 Transcript_12739/m.12398 type:complete len:223 (+) Transcript_12739:232-900(+)|eukprot:CAMPEP_0119051540 /NCGR_PEP_ID=MMETSP1177-20130426/73120_1 /TAXON_ID=2985 /ORGANISM="Ochromonas sp, Strain CCMP1899" /LENGTH=222 /DNA_ID=CAMNT_0007030771 /DNA_START=230 /DNA_END=898 /DNA_ORIENTATION=+
MDTHVWQALPPRKKTRVSKISEEVSKEKVDSDSCIIEANNLQDEIERSEVQHLQMITDNVQARSKVQRANATLESQDGCAGEFYEYLDHTADVQCHCWGKDLSAAFSNMAPCMFNYMIDLSSVVIDPKETIEFTVKGHDMQSLLFAYMDEMLFRFCTDGFCFVRVEIITFDKDLFEIALKGHGDLFDQTKHPPGTEIKAITYSNMQIHETEERADLYVIVDI